MRGTAGWHGQRRPAARAAFPFYYCRVSQLNSPRSPQINTVESIKTSIPEARTAAPGEVEDNAAYPMCVRLTTSPLFELNAGFLCEIPKHWLIHLYWSEFSPRCVASLWNIQSRALGITIIWTSAFLGASNESGCIQIKGAQSDWNHACIIMLSDKKASHLLPGSRRENWSPS